MRDDHPQVPNLWDEIWKTNTLPKVRVFAWKLASNAVAVRERLARRGMQVQFGCPMCDQLETMEHLIWGGGWVKQLWEQLLGIQVGLEGSCSLKEWLATRFAEATGTKQQRQTRWNTILITAWSIWKEICDHAFQGKQPNVATTIARVRKLVEETNTLQQNANNLQIRTNQQGTNQTQGLYNGDKWARPSRGTVKLNCDAAWITQTVRGGIRVIARNHEGQVLAGFHRSEAVSSIEQLEATTVF